MKLFIYSILCLAVFGLAGPGWSSNMPADTTANFKRMGDEYAKKGETEKAMEAYRQFIDKKSGNTAATEDAALKLGGYYFAEKEYINAVRYLRMIKGKNGQQPSVRMLLGKSLQNAGKSKEAIAVLEPLAGNPTLKIDSRRELFKTLGDAYVKTDKNAKAITWYEKCLKLGGAKSPDVSYELALLSETISPAKTKLRYEENIRSFPHDYRNFLRLGLLLAKDKAMYQRSNTLLRKTAELGDTIPEALLDIARGLNRLGKSDAELAVYEKYMKVDTTNIDVMTRMGSILLRKGQNDEAQKLFQTAHDQAPDSAGPMVGLASVYIKTGRSNDAIDLLVKIKARKPKDVEVRKNLFEAYSATGQDQQALEEIKGLVELDRDNELLLKYGKLLLKMGKFAEASNVIEDIRATAPDNIEALMTQALVLRGQNKLDEAIEIYKEVSAINAKYAPASSERADVYLVQNKIKWAEQFYKRALEADPKYALAELGLAKVALVYKNRTVYLDLLDRAAAMDPENPLIKLELENSKKVPAPEAADK